MSSSRSNRLWNSLQILALCIFIVAVIEPSDADPDQNCKGKACLKDACAKNLCKNGRCFLNGKESCCLCPYGNAGKDCGKTVCEVNPCLTSGGRCYSIGNARKCVCGLNKLLSALTGIDLQLNRCKGDSDIDVVKCEQNPCLNGGSCYQSKKNAYAYCTCPDGWKGLDCSTSTAETSIENNSGSSSGSSGSGGSSGSTDFCTPNPCVHGSCTVSGTSYTCTCEAGFQGQNCDQEVSAPTSESSQASNDLCVTNPCVHGSCSTNGTSYQCTCNPGWQGQNCDKDYCDAQPCVHGTCNNGDSSYTCTCQSGYVGTTCDKQGCFSNPCQNGGTCIPGENGSYRCECTGGWYQAHCDLIDGEMRRR